MKKSMILTPLIAVAMMTSVPMSSLAQQKATENPTGTAAATASEQSRGYKDGLEAAKLDKLANRKIDAKSSHLYQHPPVKKGPEREQYLSEFEAGYKAALDRGM